MGQYQASNISVGITVVPERKERKNRKKSEEITAEKFPNLIQTICPQIQKTQQTLTRINVKKIMPKYIVINSLKSNEENKSGQNTKQDIIFKGIMNTTRLIIRSYQRQKTIKRWH